MKWSSLSKFVRGWPVATICPLRCISPFRERVDNRLPFSGMVYRGCLAKKCPTARVLIELGDVLVLADVSPGYIKRVSGRSSMENEYRWRNERDMRRTVHDGAPVAAHRRRRLGAHLQPQR